MTDWGEADGSRPPQVRWITREEARDVHGVDVDRVDATRVRSTLLRAGTAWIRMWLEDDVTAISKRGR